MNATPVDFAKRLCKLYNADKLEKEANSNETETIDKLPSMIRKIFLKIR